MGDGGQQLMIDTAGAAETPPEAEITAWAHGQRVFLSSVMTGMAEYRQAAAAAIEGLGAEAVLFERFGGRDADPEDAYVSEVRSSTIYVGLLGERYGRPLKTRYSATHTEYLEAEKAGLRVSVWVDGTAALEGPQQSFLNEVRQFHTTGNYSAPDDLARQLRRRLVRIAAEELSPWVKLGPAIFRAREVVDTGGRVEIRSFVRDRRVISALERMRTDGFRGYEGPLTWGHSSLYVRVTAVETTTTAASGQLIRLVCERAQPLPGRGWPTDVTYNAGGRTFTTADVVEHNLRAGLFGEQLPPSNYGFGGFEAMNPLRDLLDAAVPDEIVRPLARLLLTECLVGGGRATEITQTRLGPSVQGRRRLSLSWQTPSRYVNRMEPERHIDGVVHMN